MHSYVNILIILNVESKYTLVYSKLCRFSKTRLVKRTRSALFKPPTISGKKTKGANSAFQKILFFFSCSQIIFTLLANTFSCKNAICLCLDNGTHCVCVATFGDRLQFMALERLYPMRSFYVF